MAADKVESQQYHRNFRELLALAPGDKIMVFIHYAPNHSPHMALVTNAPDLAKARAWTVYDRGAEDTEAHAARPSSHALSLRRRTRRAHPAGLDGQRCTSRA